MLAVTLANVRLLRRTLERLKCSLLIKTLLCMLGVALIDSHLALT